MIYIGYDYIPEFNFYMDIHEDCDIIFDVGSSNDSIFLDIDKDVHYFEPFSKSFDELIAKKIRNHKFNNFGLSDVAGMYKYYENLGSFLDRSEISKLESIYTGLNYELKRGDDYMLNNNIENIDFLKIDVEGMETNVFRGFGEKLKNVKYIQFEYGIGTADNGDTLFKLISYLESYGFKNFCYLNKSSQRYELTPVNYYQDHWIWCNIVCSRLDNPAYHKSINYKNWDYRFRN